MTRIVLAVLCLVGCTPGAWNPPKPGGWIDPATGCSRSMHNVRGPDEYDVATGAPYHCETPAYDPDNSDIDPVEQ